MKGAWLGTLADKKQAIVNRKNHVVIGKMRLLGFWASLLY